MARHQVAGGYNAHTLLIEDSNVVGCLQWRGNSWEVGALPSKTSRNADSGRTCKTWHESSFPGNGYVVKEITRCTRMLGDSGCSMGGKSIGERARRSETAPAYGTIFCLVRLSLSYRSERALAQRPEGAGGNAARSFRHPRGRVANRARLPPSGCHMLTFAWLAGLAEVSLRQAGAMRAGGRRGTASRSTFRVAETMFDFLATWGRRQHSLRGHGGGPWGSSAVPPPHQH